MDGKRWERKSSLADIIIFSLLLSFFLSKGREGKGRGGEGIGGHNLT